MKIVFFGDSLTWGGYGGSYVAAIRERAGDAHEIINAGVGGNTVVNLLRRVDEDVLEHEPDAVFVMIGGNDAISYSQPDTRPYYRKSMQIPDGVVTPEMFQQTYRELIGTLQLNHIQTYMGLAPAERNPTVVEAFRQYNGLAKEVARQYSVPTLDLFAEYVPADVPERQPLSIRTIQEIGSREQSGWSDWYAAQDEFGYTHTFDGLHLTPKTAEEFAARIADFIGL